MLLKAVAQRKMKLVKLLVDGGVNVNFQGYDGKTPLIVACSFVAEEKNSDSDSLIVLINLLLKSGANTNTQDMMGRTPLMYAVRHFLSIDIIQLILDNDADPNILDNDGRSTLNYIKRKCLPQYRCIFKKYMRSELNSHSYHEQRITSRSIYSQSTVDIKNNIFRRVSDSTETCRQKQLTLLPKRKCKSYTSESFIVCNPIPEENESVKQTLRTCEKLSSAEGDNQLFKDDVHRIHMNNHELKMNKKSQTLNNTANSEKAHRSIEMEDKRRKTALDNLNCKHFIKSSSRTSRQMWPGVSDIDKTMLKTEIISVPGKLPPIC
ncbi:unnamed protein product [Mytilus coruscus]|uniref:Uncharacterized protein n=1 Tax=Mytilus coruscus TaxID=42192 RepID=A0A6J8AIQ6_MYTCO|nr:unnamed protein product [Mytilus coruscus]